ncbi:DNA-binding anti-repressor SinI [Halobacillus locisalis]|uniref:DNA-binding anti-repressor SinI n=1 Tax=Halobacillus locisalis TaxID=220753 RepID=A0A838CU48_9BACI|nr:DNA-binding anti-repressor SinI [Halobacillus locisalis]
MIPENSYEDWVYLILEAKRLGMTKEQIKSFLEEEL